MDCPNEEQIIRYVSGNTEEDEAQSLEEHVVDCLSCLHHVRSLLHLTRCFDTIWDSWTPEEHGRVYRHWRLATALLEAPTLLREKALNWLKQIRNSAELTLRLLVDHTRRVAATGLGAAGADFTCHMAAAGIASPQETQLAEHLFRGSDLLVQGRVPEAMHEFLEGSQFNARAVQAATTDILREERLALRLVVDSRTQRAQVYYWPSSGKDTPSLAMLIPEQTPGPAILAEFHPVEGADYLLAEFENVSDGVHVVNIGPFNKTPPQSALKGTP